MKETKQIARITATIIKLAKFSMGKISVSYSDFVCFKSTWNVFTSGSCSLLLLIGLVENAHYYSNYARERRE